MRDYIIKHEGVFYLYSSEWRKHTGMHFFDFSDQVGSIYHFPFRNKDSFEDTPLNRKKMSVTDVIDCRVKNEA